MKKYVIEMIQDGSTFEVVTKQLVNQIWNKIDRLSLTDFNSQLEAEHYVKNVPLEQNEKIHNVIIYAEGAWSGKQHFNLMKELQELNRTVPIENIYNAIEEEEEDEVEPMIQIRQFHDGTYSVAARIYNPNKNFYEHPDYINLTEEEAKQKCQEVIDQKLTNKDIVATWLHYAN